MTKLVALLRGINVSGHRPIPMAKLVATLESRKLLSVTTYKASGNVVFESTSGTPASLAGLISTAIAEDFGHGDVEVLVLRAAEARKVAKGNPLFERGADPAHVYVTFPFRKVTDDKFESLSIPASKRETALLSGGVVYLSLPDGAGRTKLTNVWFEKAFGCPCTTRNWNTVLAMADLVSR